MVPHLSSTPNFFSTSVLSSHATQFPQLYPHRRIPSVIDRWGPHFTQYKHRIVSLTSGSHEKLTHSLSPCGQCPEWSWSQAPAARVPGRRRRRIPAGHRSVEPPHRSPLRRPSFPAAPRSSCGPWVELPARAAASRASAARRHETFHARPPASAPLPRQISSQERAGCSFPRPPPPSDSLIVEGCFSSLLYDTLIVEGCLLSC